MFHSVGLFSQMLLARGSRALSSVLLSMELCHCNYVILQTNRARSTLNKGFLDFSKSKVFLDRVVVKLVYKLDEKSTASI